MSDFHFVERPIGRRGRGGAPLDSNLIKALMETATNGKAVEYPVPRSSLQAFNQRIRTALKNLGYTAHVSHDPRKEVATLYATQLPKDEFDSVS